MKKNNWIYTLRFIQIRKETLASLMKILNDYFEVKVSEKIISRVLHAHDIERTKLILRPKLDEKVRKIESNFANITFI